MVNTINSINEWDEFEDIVSIFNSYGQDLESFINRENHADILGIQLIEIYQSQLLLDKGVDEFERAHEVSIGNGYDYAISKLQEEFTEDLLNEISELGLSEFFTTSFDFKLDEEIIKHEFDSAVEAMQEHEDESISVSGSYMEMEFEKEIEAIKNLFE